MQMYLSSNLDVIVFISNAVDFKLLMLIKLYTFVIPAWKTWNLTFEQILSQFWMSLALIGSVDFVTAVFTLCWIRVHSCAELQFIYGWGYNT